MERFAEGDRVRIDIPDETDPDHEPYHGVHGEIVSTLSDDAEAVSGREEDSQLYRVALETGETVDFRSVDLRLPLDN